MAEADRGSPGKRSPTIDLKATEVSTPPAESAPGAAETPAQPAEQAASAAVDAPQAPDTPPEATGPGFEPSTDAADGAPAHEPQASLPPPPPPPSNAPSYLAAGAAGAGLSLLVMLGMWGAGLFDRNDDSAARLESLENRLSLAARPVPAPQASSQALDQITARLAKLESTPPTPSAPAADNPAAVQRLAGAEASAKAAADKVAVLERQLQELATATREARQRADAAAAAAQASQTATVTDTATERREIEALAGRVAAAEAAVKQIADEAARRAAEGAVDRAVRRALASIALRNAVERGTPFTAELAAAKPLVADPKVLEPLEPFAATGLPSARTLGAELSRVASPMVRAADAPPREGGFLDKLQANAERLVRVRPVGDAPGDDAPAIVARAEARAKDGDLAAALAELRKLPEPVRAPAADWIKQAEAYLAAVEAGRKLSADAVGGLSRS